LSIVNLFTGYNSSSCSSSTSFKHHTAGNTPLFNNQTLQQSVSKSLKTPHQLHQIRGDIAARSGTVRVTRTAYLCRVCNYCFLLTAVSCNVASKRTRFYKFTINLISTVCIHYTHTHTYIYIYVCVSVCEREREVPDNSNRPLSLIRDFIFWFIPAQILRRATWTLSQNCTAVHCRTSAMCQLTPSVLQCTLQNFSDVPANTKCSAVHIAELRRCAI